METELSKFALNAPAINRAKRPGKLIDGGGLFFMRNGDGTLTPWQRVRLPGAPSIGSKRAESTARVRSKPALGRASDERCGKGSTAPGPS